MFFSQAVTLKIFRRHKVTMIRAQSVTSIARTTIATSTTTRGRSLVVSTTTATIRPTIVSLSVSGNKKNTNHIEWWHSFSWRQFSSFHKCHHCCSFRTVNHILLSAEWSLCRPISGSSVSGHSFTMWHCLDHLTSALVRKRQTPLV